MIHSQESVLNQIKIGNTINVSISLREYITALQTSISILISMYYRLTLAGECLIGLDTAHVLCPRSSLLSISYRRSQYPSQADGLSLSCIGQLSPLLNLNRLCMKLMQDQRLSACMNAHQKQ